LKRDEKRNAVRSAALKALFVLVLGLLSFSAYMAEVGEYARRVFGYYSSITVEQNLSRWRDSTYAVGVRAQTDRNCLNRIISPKQFPPVPLPKPHN